MSSRLRFRNLDVEPASPVHTWPPEGIQAALERGSLSDYRRMAAELRRDPWGEFARRLESVLRYSTPYGSAALMRQAIDRSRAAADSAAKREVARRLERARTTAGLTRAEFARRLGTSPSRMSTYLSGDVTPLASLLVRAERLGCDVLDGQDVSAGRDGSAPHCDHEPV